MIFRCTCRLGLAGFGRALVAVGLAAAASPSGRVAAASPPVSFAREVKPLLARRCFACHGPTAGEGGLHLDKRDAALAELDSGLRAIVPGDADDSALVARVSSTDEGTRMPPEGKPLAPEEIAALRAWIAAGAKWEEHWAFVPLERREPPAVKRRGWVSNPIDAFVLARLETAGLAPAAEADRRTLIRRAYFDVTGLPPPLEELDSLLADTGADAWGRLIDRLLASPHYGERWARHWLDLVRYADTNSFERDGLKPNAWKYRDYVIRSLNADKPYDQFLREQLAGDELDEVTDETIIATGYYRLGIWDDEPADPLQARFDEWDDIVSTTGQAVLGLTVGCARCHDHKIDPIPQADYYGLVAFFADVTPYGSRSDEATNSQWDLSPAHQRAQREKLKGREQAIGRRMEEIENAGIKRMSAPDQRRAETNERQWLMSDKLEQYLSAEEWENYQRHRKKRDAIHNRIEKLPTAITALAVARCDPRPEPVHVMLRGNPHAPGDVAPPHFPTIFGEAPPTIPAAPTGARSAGRRRVLADWIAAPRNLLTARVIVNRVWQHHFGRGIVRSANNFGELGTPPTHPELLDWLALWLIDHNWQLKPLHRLIMTSNAYRMSSAGDDRALAVDPTNDLLWRFDMRRLSAEEVRDATLAVTGELNPKMYGPGFFEKLSPEVLATQSRPGEGWGEAPSEDLRRRSVYIHVKRSLVTPLLTAFDFPDADLSCEARFNTTQPGQALTMLNSAWANERAAKLAERVLAETGQDSWQQVAAAFRLAVGRAATDEEIAEGVALVERFAREHGQPPREALRYWCLTALNLNEFVYLD